MWRLYVSRLLAYFWPMKKETTFQVYEKKDKTVSRYLGITKMNI